MTQLQDISTKVAKVIAMYKEEYPDVNMDRDYVPFKLTEELGELMQRYLMLTDRGRQKGMTKKDIKQEFARELADVFGYLLAFADQEGVDIAEAIDQKWFAYLKQAD